MGFLVVTGESSPRVCAKYKYLKDKNGPEISEQINYQDLDDVDSNIQFLKISRIPPPLPKNQSCYIQYSQDIKTD